MQTKSHLSFGTTVGGIFFLGLFAAMFFRDQVFELIAPEPVEVSESKKASREVAEALLKLDKISLDTTILKSDYFTNITLLPTFPTDSKTLANFGKTNPFLGNFSVVSSPASLNTENASSTVGGVIYSQQRSVNDDRSIVPVRNGRGQAPQGRR